MCCLFGGEYDHHNHHHHHHTNCCPEAFTYHTIFQKITIEIRAEKKTKFFAGETVSQKFSSYLQKYTNFLIVFVLFFVVLGCLLNSQVPPFHQLPLKTKTKRLKTVVLQHSQITLQIFLRLFQQATKIPSN